jgi:hypothetical protein
MAETKTENKVKARVLGEGTVIFGNTQVAKPGETIELTESEFKSLEELNRVKKA